MYRHKKTNRIYKVLSLALIENTLDAAIVYQSVDDGLVWIRPAKTFLTDDLKKWRKKMIPKFRAWDKYDDEMVTDIYFNWQDCGYESLNEVFSDDRWIFMQSTGLKDKNGKEIFEGDIVVDCFHVPYEVRYNSDFCAFFLYPLEDPEEFTGIYPEMELEIIGNKYENPELVEG